MEALFGGVPQDIEWALAEGRLWLLQARPMTALPPAPLKDVNWEPPIPGTKWVRRQVAENMPEPLSPLFEELYLRDGLESSMQNVIERAGKASVVSEADRPWYTTVNGYAYLRGSFTLNWKIVRNTVVVMAKGTIIRAIFSAGIPYWRDEVLPSHLARWNGGRSSTRLSIGRAAAGRNPGVGHGGGHVLGRSQLRDCRDEGQRHSPESIPHRGRAVEWPDQRPLPPRLPREERWMPKQICRRSPGR